MANHEPDSLPPSQSRVSLPPSKYELTRLSSACPFTMCFSPTIFPSSDCRVFPGWPSAVGLDGQPRHISDRYSLDMSKDSFDRFSCFQNHIPFQPITPWPVQHTLFPRRKLDITPAVRPYLSTMEEKEDGTSMDPRLFQDTSPST